MKKETRYYEVFPRLVQAGEKTMLTIHPLFDHCRFKAGQTYTVTLLPAEGLAGQVNWQDGQKVTLAPQNGDLQANFFFPEEQEYILLVETQGTGRPPAPTEFRLYALDADLFARRPYKGDMHMHTYYSDGKESPAYVAAACRKIGLDFMAITDHGQYAPSLEAISALAGVDTDLRVYPGEEVHPPENRVHMVNFGGRFSINDLFKSETYRAEVQALTEKYALPEGVDAYPLASCLWCFDKIREAGGLGIFCHPYWFSTRRYDVPHTLIDLIFECQPFDALELIGGYHRHETESNTLQVARYHEERARGRKIPVVGVSDSHGCEADLFGWYFTIIFAPSNDLPDLVASINHLYSVAVEALPGEPVRAHGPFRFVRYAQFLLREIFPMHDELCYEEGRLLMAHSAGDPAAASSLNRLKGRARKLYDRMWGSDLLD